jgi:hypothetical protein
MRYTILVLVAICTSSLGVAQAWQVPYKNANVQIDGFIKEWEGIPKIVLRPGAPGVGVEGEFNQDGLDVELTMQAQWDEESLFVAVHWKDDVWDLRKIRRSDAVFVTPDKRRRDRMLFYDYVKLQIKELKYDYLMWFSPRVEDEGPYYWHRRTEGLGAMEGATASPVLTPREQDDGSVTMELQFSWKELRIKTKKKLKTGLPIQLLVSDSDRPGLIEESKLAGLKSLQWNGQMQLGPPPGKSKRK